jgi:hypothetical protein
MTEYVNKRKMTQQGSLAAMGRRGEGEEHGGGAALALPGVKAGDMASRTFRPEVRVSCVRFAPNGTSSVHVKPIDYRCQDRAKVGELRGDFGAVGYVLTPSIRNPDHNLQKTNRSARRSF